MLAGRLRMSSSITRNTATAPSQVIVVGSGLAGLSASSELVARGVPVQILERQQKPGGNSIKASSGINGVPTRFQVPGSDTVADFYNDTLKSAGASFRASRTEARQKLITELTDSSASAINWLVDEKGVDLSHVALLGGHSHARTHRGAGPTPPGASIVLTLLKQLQASPLVTLQTATTVTKILKSDGEVVGVQVSRDGKPETLEGAVVFTAGGFAGDSTGLLAQYRPDLEGFPSTNEALPGSQTLLTDVGAHLVDMEQVQVHPTGFVDPKDPFKQTKFLAAEALRGEGGILLRQGKRFINELRTRKQVTEAILAQPPKDSQPTKQWDIQILMDEGAYQAAKSHVDFYMWKGLMRKTTISELDHADEALKTIKEYAATVQGTSADSLGRSSFGQWALQGPKPDSTVYVGSVTPVVHYTMGGAIFSPEAEVLDAAGQPIKGLWAAGESTGGIHGDNRLGGSSLLECVVFGRIAGQNAAKFLGA
ncbi:Fumarate reductase [Fonsecaea pedrosoi]|nr:Fumarate reductase [Fonsecaea pedrosoi]